MMHVFTPCIVKRCIAIATLPLLLTSCAILQPPPPNVNNLCSIFEAKQSWYPAAQQAEQRWGTPAPVIMAFMNQESSFKSNARPPRKKFFGIIPWLRPTSAYGYAQALDGTWEDYKKETGRKWVFRNNFKDAADFIGWYNSKASRTLNIRQTDARRLYLAYHEGIRGYSKKSYEKKKWLIGVADKVQKQTDRYTKQLSSCKKNLVTPWYKKLML